MFIKKATATIKSYLPSRGWAIFLGSVGSIAGLMVYDKRQVRQIQRQFKEIASEFANKPAGSVNDCSVYFLLALLQRKIGLEWNAVNRKVLVIVEPSSWSPYWFKEFVKPIFDAGAVDYELYEPNHHPAEIIERVRKLVWDARDQHQLQIHRKSVKSKMEQARGSFGSWFEFGPAVSANDQEEDLKRLEDELTEKYLPHLHTPKYNPRVGIVALGPIPWRHVLRGIEEGSLTTRANENDSRQTRNEQNQLDPSIVYPTLGFISGQDLSGWSYVPLRIAGWFSKRYMCQKIAEDTLVIIKNNSRPLETSKDLGRGSDSFRPFEKKDEKEKSDLDRINEMWTEEAERMESVDPLIASRLSIYS